MGRHTHVFAVVGVLVVCVSVALAQQQPTLKITVTPERENNAYTGRYVAKVEVVGAPAAREVVANIGIPTAYEMDVSAQGITIKDVRPGADTYSVDVQGTPTNVCFVESSEVNDRNSIWVVALLTEDQKDPKHVCDIVFTAKGRPTAMQITTADVEVKDGDLNVLADAASLKTRCPLFGDLDWDGEIDFDDVLLLAAAWEAAHSANPKVLDFADLHPYTGPDTLEGRVSTDGAGRGEINFDDVLALAWAWEQYHQ